MKSFFVAAAIACLAGTASASNVGMTAFTDMSKNYLTMSASVTASMKTGMNKISNALEKSQAALLKAKSSERLTSNINETMAAAEKVMQRSDDLHRRSMTAITHSLNGTDQAIAMVEKTDSDKAKQLRGMVSKVDKRSNFRQIPKKQRETVMTTLNNFIYEAMYNYDADISKCTSFYTSQCHLLKQAQGDIMEANVLMNKADEKLLSAKRTFDTCFNQYTATVTSLKEIVRDCNRDARSLKNKLDLIRSDVQVLEIILGLIGPCKEGRFFLTQSNKEVRKQIQNLKSKKAQKMIMSLLRTTAAPGVKTVDKQKPLTPRTPVPDNGGCEDGQNKGAPSAEMQVRCRLGKGQCQDLKRQFWEMLWDVKDDVTETEHLLFVLEEECKEKINTHIATISTVIETKNFALELGTKGAQELNENKQFSDEAAEKFGELKKELKERMGECQKGYLMSEGELCALKKIRGEASKLGQGPNAPPFVVTDCAVGKWDPQTINDKICTKKCATGKMLLVREEVTPQSPGGAKCLPLEWETDCNHQPCPQKCKTEPWSEWGACTSECNGGQRSRFKSVVQMARFGAAPCESTTDTESCNTQACNKDCVLEDWAPWSNECSKRCDGGTKMRYRMIKEQAEGTGTCASRDDPTRLEYKNCNDKPCPVDLMNGKAAVLPCAKPKSLVIILEMTVTMGYAGFLKLKALADWVITSFIRGRGSAFVNEAYNNERSQILVRIFGGPESVAAAKQCDGARSQELDYPNTCRQWSFGWTGVSDWQNLRQKIDEFEFEADVTSRMDMAFNDVLADFMNAEHAVDVVVLSDGVVSSNSRTKAAARKLRQSARLSFMLLDRRQHLKEVKSWVTRRWQENLVVVQDMVERQATKLSNKIEHMLAEGVTHLIADICPDEQVYGRLIQANAEVPEGVIQPNIVDGKTADEINEGIGRF